MSLFEPDFSHLDSMSAREYEQWNREQKKLYELSVAYDTPRETKFMRIFHQPQT